MKVFMHHSGSNGVSQYRTWQVAKYLGRMDGFTVKRLPDHSERVHIPMLDGESNVPGIGSWDSITAESDVIISQYKAGFEDSSRLVCQSKIKPVVIDCDDDILNIDPTNPNYASWHSADGKKPGIIEIPAGEQDSAEWKQKAADSKGVIAEKNGKWFLVGPSVDFIQNVIQEMRHAAMVTVSTERLREVYSRYNPDTYVIPNAVDFEIWPENKKKNDGFIRLGLFGSNTHYKDWREVSDTLAKILAEFPNVKLCYNSWFKAYNVKQGQKMEDMDKVPQFPDFFDELGLIEHPQVEIFEGVEIQYWPKALADVGIDIGLAPLADTTFNKAKSNLKYLEFSALKIAGVYEKMEPYQDDIQHGENGFLARHPADWYSCIKRLIEDTELRNRMANKAHEDVRKRYDQKDVSAKLAGLLTKIGANQPALA